MKELIDKLETRLEELKDTQKMINPKVNSEDYHGKTNYPNIASVSNIEGQIEELERTLRIVKYFDLLHRVKIDPYYDMDMGNRVNSYTCANCHKVTKTIDRDPGCTPFMHRCVHCNELAQSHFYTDIAPSQEINGEWYRPELDELLTLPEGVVEHVLNGGLIFRRIN